MEQKYLAVNVDALWRRIVDVLLGEPGHQVLANDAVQGPAFVASRHLLSHGRQEALWVEKPGHPEDLRKSKLV